MIQQKPFILGAHLGWGTLWLRAGGMGSYLWAWLLPGWMGRCKTRWARSVFHWYDYLAAVFVPSLETTVVML